MAKDKYNLDDLDLDLSGDYGQEGEDFSLESILAEFKGSAFMDGDKPTPSEELQRKTEAIINEALGAVGRSGGEPKPAPEPEPEPAPEPEPEPEYDLDGDDYPWEEDTPHAGFLSRLFRGRKNRDAEEDDLTDDPEDGENEMPESRPARHVPVNQPEEFSEPAYDVAPEIDTSVFDEPDRPETGDDMEKFLNSLRSEKFTADLDGDDAAGKYAGAGAVREFSDEVRQVEAQGQEEEEEDESRRRRGIFGLFSRRREELPEDGEEYGDDEYGQDPEYIDDEDYYDVEPDPDFKKEAARFAAMVPSLRFRILGAAVLCAAMALITFVFAAKGSAPFGIGKNAAVCTGVLMILELLVMGLGLDVLIRGFEDMLALSPGAETLVFISCLISILDGFHMLSRGSFTNGLPLSLVSGVSLLGAMSARKSYYMAICDSLRASKAASVTYGVTADHESMEGRNILKKVTGASEGFYTRLVSPDVGERFYDDMAPLLVVAAFVLAFMASVGRGRIDSFAHSFSILTAVAAAFPATVLFALPFKYAASCLKKAGSAVAGYAGAREIFYTDGALITDQDIFPTGSVSLSGIKIFEGVNAQKVVLDTASLIIASDSGLRKVFEELLRSQGLTRRRTDDFACYDGGGIGALIDGERVLVGTGAFMNLMGIRVPENVNTSNTLFTAVNDQLGGAFSLNYVPANSVQSALVTLLNTRTNLLMAVRDFNVTPNTVKQKFKVSMDGVEYLPIETTYDLSQNSLTPGSYVSAILCRGGLAPFAEAITRGRALKLVTEMNTWITGIGTILGVIIMFFLCWAGAFASASAGNIFIFMAVIGLAVYVMSQGARRRMK